MCEHEHEEKENEKLNILFIIIGVIISVFAHFSKIESVSFLLYLAGYICIGYDIYLKAIKKLFKKDMFDENFLMVIATIGAFAINEYIEAILVILLYKIGEFLQDKAVENSKKKINEVLNIKAPYANLVINEKIKKVNPESLNIGDVIIIKTGEKVPVDGVVTSGNTSLDMKALTGESKPISIKENDNILSGAINIGSTIYVKVSSAFKDSTVSQIIDLIENATDKKSKTENLITRFAKVYTPIVIFIALIIVLLPLFCNITFRVALHRAFTFLVISCPCAIVISVPLSFFVGIGVSSKFGILVKGSNYLDALNDINVIAFDKTGTLTKGKFEITGVYLKNNKFSKEELLTLVVACEKYSNHYIAKSIVDSYKNQVTFDVSSHEEIAGQGIKAIVNDYNILVGNKKLLEDEKVNVSDINGNIDDEGKTFVYVAINSEYIGYITLADTLKTDAESISNLKKYGIKKTIMLTGDTKLIAEKIAKEAKIDRVYDSLLPQDKVKIVEEIKENLGKKEKLAYVGDGINDSPVLAAADIGISMGNGADIAVETADIVLMSEELNKLETVLKIARKTRKVVIENISFAIVIKVMFLILGSIGKMTMFFAVFADVGVALITIINAMRIFKIR